MAKSEKALNRLTIYVGAILACFVGFYNKFPLVYSDTGTYIRSGFTNYIPDDRPVFYGLFIRHISLAVSPWLVILAQGLICSYLIFLTFKLFFRGSATQRNIFFLLTITLLSLLTGFSHNVSILLPDIFSAIGLLSLLHLFVNETLKSWEKGILIFLFVLSLMMHLSNIMTIGLLLGSLLMLRILQRRSEHLITYKRHITLLGVFLVAFALVPIVHYAIGGKFQYSRMGHVFQISHLIETGILQKYLNDKCDQEDFKICEFKDQLSWDFIWSENSVLHKTSGPEKNSKEYKQIIRNIYGSPSYWPIIAQKSVESGFRQFFTFETVAPAPRLIGSAPFGAIEWHFASSWREYLMSKQNNKALKLEFLNAMEPFVILLGMLVCFIYLIYPMNFEKDQRLLFAGKLLFWFGIFNSLVCANLSTVDARFQNRWVWIFPLIGIFISLELYKNYRRQQKEKASTVPRRSQ